MKKYVTLILFSTCILGGVFQSCKKKDSETSSSTITKYNKDIRDIMSAHCTSCHAGSAPFGNLSLTTYREVKNAAQNNGLYSRMTSNTIPMPSSGKLSSDKLDKINAWIQNGYPEN